MKNQTIMRCFSFHEETGDAARTYSYDLLSRFQRAWALSGETTLLRKLCRSFLKKIFHQKV